MNRPQVYYVNGTVAAREGDHIFKNEVAGYGASIEKLKEVADVIELIPDDRGVYFLKNEGCGTDYGEKYLVASQNVAAGGCKGQGGSIGYTLSPVRSYNEYVSNIDAIKKLLELNLDDELIRNHYRLLFVGVCGELEGYLSSTFIALIQGVREVFLALRDEFDDPTHGKEDEHLWRDEIVNHINKIFQFQHVRNRDSKERKLYEKLLGQKLPITQELRDDIEWRNKLAHRVPYYTKPTYPSKNDVLQFIKQAYLLVDFIDERISDYKHNWLEVF